MAFTLLNSYESVASDNAFDAVIADAGCTNATDATQLAHGLKSKKLIVANGTNLRAYDGWTSSLPLGITGATYYRAYFRLSATATSEATLFRSLGDTGDVLLRVAVSTAGKLTVFDNSDTLIATGTTTIAANTWYRVEVNCTGFAAAQTATVRLYATIDSTGAPTETLTTPSSNFSFGTSVRMGEIRWGFGKFITGGSATLWLDDVGVTDQGLLGPASIAKTGTTETPALTDVSALALLINTTDAATGADLNNGLGIPTTDALALADPTPTANATLATTEALTGADVSAMTVPLSTGDAVHVAEMSIVTTRTNNPIAEGPLTICSIMDEVLDVVHGYVRGQESRTHLAATITDTDTTLTVADPSLVSSGLMEIDEELTYVSKVDLNTGIVTLEPWGRAQSQTQAVPHLVGTRVTNNPIFPRQRVRNVIWGVLREMFPDIYAVGETLLDINPAKSNYPMPADCFHILQVQWHLPGPSGMWAEANRWRQSKRSGGPVELELLSRVWPGQGRVRVEYAKNAATQFGQCDDLALYGYDFEVRDVIVLGSAARLMAFTDTARVLTESVVSHGRDEVVPAGSATAVSKYLYTLFQQRIANERTQQLMRHPIQVHMTR